MKYIMMEKLNHESQIITRLPIIFADAIVHYNMAQMARHHTMLGVDWKVDSAGFYCPIRQICHGKSESLNLESKPARDRLIILNLEYTKGIEGGLELFT